MAPPTKMASEPPRRTCTQQGYRAAAGACLGERAWRRTEAVDLLAAHADEARLHLGVGDAAEREDAAQLRRERLAVGGEHEELLVAAVEGGEQGALQQRADEARHRAVPT